MSLGFLIDMDGVIYRGSETISGAVNFVDLLISREIPFMFLTNNSQRTPIDIATKLQRIGFKVQAEHVYTSAMATASYLAHQSPNGTAYAIGEGGLLTALNQEGYAIVDSNPDYVVIGEGRTMTLENMERAVQLVADGARLIATNLDPSCPTQDGGVRPGCGAYVKMIEESTGFSAFSAGKPSPVIFREARKRMNLRSAETVMVGDTMETDILGAVQLGYHSILVLSGGTQEEDIKRFSYRPDHVVPSVASINDELIDKILAKADKKES